MKDLFEQQQDSSNDASTRPLKNFAESPDKSEIEATDARMHSEDFISAENPPIKNHNSAINSSMVKKQKSFLNDLANHHDDSVDRHMSFGTNMAANPSIYAGAKDKSRKTVRFVDNEAGDNDMEFEEGQNYGDTERRKSMDKYFQKAKGRNQGKVRGFTIIKDLLMDFENDSDFMVSQPSRRVGDGPSDLVSVNNYNSQGRASDLLGSQVNSQVNIPMDAQQQYQSNNAYDVSALIESSKNLLYDLKLLEDRSDSQVERYLIGEDGKRRTAAFGVVDGVNKEAPVGIEQVDLEVPDSGRESEKS